MSEAASASCTGAVGLGAARRLVCVAITALLFLSGKCFPDLDYRNLYTDVSPEVVTEHTAWAKPYYRGSLRSLWIIPLPESGSPRLAAEVRQRLSLDYAVCLVYSRDFLGSDTAKDDYTRQIPTTHEEPVRKDLAAKIAGSYEVMVIDDVHWTTFPPEVRQAIISKVRAGMGLVFTCPPAGNPPPDLQSLLSEKVDSAEAIEAAFPTEALSCFRGLSPLVRTFQCGQGRIGVLPPQSTSAPEDPQGTGPVTRWADPIVLNDEYDQARLVRTLLWAAHREPEVIVREMKLEAAKVAPYAATLRLRTSSSFETPRQFTAEIRCRDLRNWTCGASIQSITLPTGQGNIELRLATLKPVKQFVDLWLREGDKTVCWGSSYVEVSPEVPIQQVRLTQDCYQKDQTVSGEVVFAGPPTSTSLLTVELWDNVERLLGRQQLALTKRGHPVVFKFPARDLTTPVAWIRCRIQQGSRLLGWAEQETLVHQRPPQYDFVLGCSGTQMWNMNIFRWHQIAVRRRELSKFGIQYGYLWGGPAAAALFTRENQTIIAGLGGIWCDTSRTQQGTRVRRPCLSDPAFRVEARKVAQEEAGRLKVYGPPFYSLAGEFALGRRKDGSPDLCFSPSCLDFFRTYVKEQYETLEALNREYGTQYQDWSEVKPALYEEAKAAGNFAPYVDHLLAMEAVVADFFDDMAKTVRKLDPRCQGWHGQSLSPRLWSGSGPDRCANRLQLPSVREDFRRPCELRLRG